MIYIYYFNKYSQIRKFSLKTKIEIKYSFYVLTVHFIVYYLFVPINAHTHIQIYIYIGAFSNNNLAL